ncbi:MAG TPA: hypothetical protein VFP84_33795 [Kofleriaceae bacterium]|nr:hypothetical protein [Kofleriaceae bacterium]
MGNLQRIEQRHRPDRWRDIVFLAGTALLAALSLGAVTHQAAGTVHERQWTVTVIEGALEVMR